MSVITLDHVAYRYASGAGWVEAVKDATFEFEAGKMYAIVGRSGSGKTTLLSVIAGLDVPWKGRVLVEGEDTVSMDRDLYRRTRMGMIYQQFYLLAQLTARENVELALELAKWKDKKSRLKRAEELLTKVGLTPEQFRKYPHKLSGGEQQRVAVARALAPDPQLILADEPTGNLDNENGRNIVTLLQQLAHQEGRCVIVITHASEVAEAADRVLHMNDGVLEG
ncbi:MAG: ABC transporter ATP-binding protein [Clostridia bacterium]|nr:ABC transporter ATP-binding protein [Clostridia bacterium]